MSTTTKIEWTDATWSPTLGCTKVSPGCDNCYAMRTVHRMSFNPNEKVSATAESLTAYRPGVGPVWTNLVRTLPDRLDLPLKWRKPRRIFVDSQSDLFHEHVPDEFIACVFAVMAAARRHTFQILTKRHARMRSLLDSDTFMHRALNLSDEPFPVPMGALPHGDTWPLPNVWLGVSVEDQKWADIRIPALLDTPAAVRFLSCEPLLGPVDLERYLFTGERRSSELFDPTDWVIVGGESGPRARPMHPDWARQLRDQCAAAGVPFHFKQWGEWRPQPLYYTDSRHHLVQPDGRDRGTPWPGWKLDRPDAVVMERAGKKAAGRELDGRTHDEFPEMAHA